VNALTDEEKLAELVEKFMKTSGSPFERLNARLLLAIQKELLMIHAELRRHPIKRLLGLK